MLLVEDCRRLAQVVYLGMSLACVSGSNRGSIGHERFGLTDRDSTLSDSPNLTIFGAIREGTRY